MAVYGVDSDRAINLNFNLKNSLPFIQELKSSLKPKDWVCDYPVLVYVKSFSQLVFINLLDKDEKNCQKVIDISPFGFLCFVETAVGSNMQLYHK